MTSRFLNLIMTIVSSRVWRSARLNRSIRRIAALSFIILFLVFIISLFESRVNEPFKSIGNTFYWLMVTITTVGYGDITPKTAIGRIFTVLLILIGVVLVSFMTATIASILTTIRIREGMGLKKVELEGHIVICGYNFNIERVIRSIIRISKLPLPKIVLISDHPESEMTSLIERFPEASIRFVHGDYTMESTLDMASVIKASAAIILADPGSDGSAKPDDRTLITALAIKSLSQDVRVCVELLDAASEVHLKRAGVDQIILSGEFSGFLLANAVVSPGIPQALKEIMFVNIGSDMRRIEIPNDIVGKSFREAAIEFFDRFSMVLLGVITEKKSFSLETILAGEKDAIDDFIRRKFEEAGRSLEIEAKGRITININPGKDYIITKEDHAVVLTPKS